MEVIVIYLALCVAVGAVANSRGRHGPGWFLVSLLISPLIAVIIVLIMPTAHPADLARAQVDSEPQKRCPYCAELVNFRAIKCRHCGSELELESDTPSVTRTAAKLPESEHGPGYSTKNQKNLPVEIAKTLIPFAILGFIVWVVSALK